MVKRLSSPKKNIKKALQISRPTDTRRVCSIHKQAANDTELLEMVEEGMEYYLKQSNA